MSLARRSEAPEPETPVVSLRQGALIVDLQKPRRVLSSAPFGGGLGWKRFLVNRTVSGNFRYDDVDSAIRQLLATHELACETTVCALTAVDTLEHQRADATEGDVTASVYVTVGLANLSAPGLSPLAAHAPGTINIFALVTADLPDAALVETVQIVTEVKARRLAGRLTRDGHVATGTSTDTVTVALLSGPSHRYAGAVTQVGRALARATDTALEQALSP